MGSINLKNLLSFRHFSKIYIPLCILFFIVIAGIVGYMVIEKYNFLDAFYMTIITVATVGFREVNPLSDEGKIFTSFLIITSFGTFAYAVTSISRYIIDGEFNRYFKDYRVTTAIEKLENHVIVCGYGRNGRQAAHILKNHHQRFVVVELKREVVDSLNHRYKELVFLSTERNIKGLISLLNVLDTQRQLNEAEQKLLDSDTATLLDLIALYKALGGGWEVYTP